MTKPVLDAKTRTENLRRSSQENFDAWFKSRHWRVCSEVTGTKTMDGYRVYYFQGFFQVRPPAGFVTPLGRKGRSGYLIAEVDDQGKDLSGDLVYPFGRIVLEKAIGQYQSVSGLPGRDPRRQGASWQE